MSLYRIRAVAELTGVSTATLRAWERRYGVPAPSRAASAYRLYDDADVALVTRMRDIVESGVAPAEAARALRHQAASDGEPSGHADAHELACDRIVEAAERFDVDAMREEVTRSLALGSAVVIFERVLAPALARIGDLWHDGEITIAQEHLLSGIVFGRTHQLLELVQPPDAPRRVALACFENEEHVIGLYGAGLHFATWGYRSVFLGPRTPPEAVAKVVSALEVDVVALSTTCPPPAARARALVDAYADACRGAPWLVGGQGLGAVGNFVTARGGIVADMAFPDLRRAVDRAVRSERQPLVDGNTDGGPDSESHGS